jgi:hypothetical protein
MDNRQPAKTMAWALVIWFVPVVGLVFYLFFGLNTRKEKFISQRSMDQLSKRSMLEFVEQKNLQLPAEFLNKIHILPGGFPQSVMHMDDMEMKVHFRTQGIKDQKKTQ